MHQFDFHDSNHGDVAQTFFHQKCYPLSMKTNKSFTNPWSWSMDEKLRSRYIYNGIRALVPDLDSFKSMLATSNPSPTIAEDSTQPLKTVYNINTHILRSNFIQYALRMLYAFSILWSLCVLGKAFRWLMAGYTTVDYNGYMSCS